MKLIIRNHETDGCTYECLNIIPVEYSCKEDLILLFLTEVDKIKEQEYWKNSYINLFGYCFKAEDVYHQIEHNVFTLEEWFEQFKK